MVYQISEKNQILLVLFMIVVLCAGKLFKDYLFRRGYIEGLTVIPQSNVILRRNATNTTTVTITLNLKLGADLGSDGTITVSWPTGKGVTMSTTETDYTASIVSKATTSSANAAISSDTLTTDNNVATRVRYKLSSGPLNKDSILNIKMENVTIASGTDAINDFAFTTTAGSESAVVTPILILAPSSDSSLSETSSVQEIRDALNTINTRLNQSPSPVDPERANLLKAQNALISVLAYTYGTIKEVGNVFNSGELYEAQKTAMQFIASEKKRAAKNADSLKQDNLNKRRMAQINTYYTRNYEANTEVMKNIIYVSVSLIVLAVLRNKELIPASIATLGVIFVLTLGGIVVGTQVFDIIRRNDHDFDKYDWNFNEDELNRKQLLQQNSDPANLSEMGMGMAPCYGPGCCNIGTKWNESDKKCVPVGSAVFATGTLTINVNIKVALDATDKITLSLPSGFGQVTGTNIALTGGSGTVSLIEPFDVTPGTKSANTIHIITITNLTAPSANSADKTLKVSTTKEPTEGSIYIMGI